jgi:hypothetical protein
VKKQGIVGVVHDIAEFNVADVPAKLRRLADQLERSRQPVRCCVVTLDVADQPLCIETYGRDGDMLRTIGLLQYARATLTSSLVDFDNFGPQPPSAS